MPSQATASISAGPAAGPRIAIVRSRDGIDAIAGQWRALERRAADPMTWFQSLDWCRTWCRFHDEGGIRIATAWQDDRLVLVWPLMLTGSPWTVRRVVPLTMPHGQYGNMIVDPALRADGSLRATIAACEPTEPSSSTMPLRPRP